MPLPKPRDGETQDEFMGRCMSDDVMNEEYPDGDQRYAVCHRLWKEKEAMREFRTFPIEMRLGGEAQSPKITGHAAVFNKLSENLGGYREKIAPGAFARTIETADIRALFNHDPNYVLGRTTSGTLWLKEDDKGLAIEIDPPDTQWARDLMVSIKRGDISQMSFAFATVKDRWEHQEGKESIRILDDVDLFDVSPVTYPAYVQTDVKVRSAFARAGLDWDALSGVIFRADRGMVLTPIDRETVSAAVAVLQRYLARDSGMTADEIDRRMAAMGLR